VAGLEYERSIGTETHYTPLTVSYSQNSHNMMSAIKRGDWNYTYTFTYDKLFRLIFLSIELPQNGVNNYTIEYDDYSNVVSVERYANISGTAGTSKTEYSDYDNHSNTFRLLVNVFHAPAFVSAYGTLRWDAVSLGRLLSANNAGKIVTDTSETACQYEYDANDYPVNISENGTTWLKIEYHN
jgi:hypothetical protein